MHVFFLGEKNISVDFFHILQVAVDSAVNLPWTNFTHAHMCLNPPAAFYLVSCVIPPLMVTFQQQQLQYYNHFTEFPKCSFAIYLTHNNSHFPTTATLQQSSPYNSHLCTTANSIQQPPLYNSHLPTTSNSLQ